MVSQVLTTHRVGAYRSDLLSIRRSIELLANVTILCIEVIVLAKEAQVRFVASFSCSVRDGHIFGQRSCTVVHVALRLLRRLSAFLFKRFLL
jgi:hypothetical protein